MDSPIPKENNKRRGSLKKGFTNPRQRMFDRSLSRTGRDRSLKRDGSGSFNWGSIHKVNEEAYEAVEEGIVYREQRSVNEPKISIGRTLEEEQLSAREEEYEGEWEDEEDDERELNQEELGHSHLTEEEKLKDETQSE